jgi:hypothetical protein
MADAGAPYCSGVIEHLDDVRWPERMLTMLVHNVPTAPGAAAISTEVDVLGLLAWLFRDQLVEKINRELDQDSDDEHSLSQEARQEAQATIDADLLDIERQLAALTWQMRRDGMNIEFDKISPLAILGVAVVNTGPRQPPTGSSPGRTSLPPRR